ncbi:MAG: hypothetical protein RDU20_02170 [Desulfomonilaceae bacterium]|nr:hypothetical protein [Desulfomonilaceae bacterium]
MKISFLKVLAAALLVAMFGAVGPGLGDDYLIIKKKDGSTQKVPLKFPAGEIEAFDVESAPVDRDEPPGRPPTPAAEREPGTILPGETPTDEELPGLPPSSSPFIQKDPEARRPDEERVVPPRGPGRAPEGPKRTEAPSDVVGRPVTGPLPAALPGGRGTFSVNVYKLPENVQALPDFSAFRPQTTLTADRIDIEPGKTEASLVGLPEDTDGMGLRFVGVFLVSGEGIFRWRLQSKDGSRMHIDDKTLIENDGIHEVSSKTGYVHLAEGVHTLIVDSFNSKGSPMLKLFVQPPVGPEQVFSISKGLAGWKEPEKPYDVLWGQVYFIPKGSYPEGPDFSRLSPIGRLIAPDLSISGDKGFEGLPARANMVGIRYQGFFNVEGAGVFAFRLATDNYAKLTIGKDTIVEVAEGAKEGAEGKLGWAFLQEGSYPLGVDYFHEKGEPRLELFVTQPEKEEEVFAPSRTLTGYAGDSGKLSLIPAFVYFLKPGTKKLPNFNKMSPSGMFFTKAVDYPVDRGSTTFPGVPQRERWLGLRFYVKFSLSEQESGTYGFRVVSRDGSRLIIGKKVVINAEGVGKVNEESGKMDLKAGSHEMFLDYFQTTGPNGLQLFITPPGGEEKIFAFN